MSLTHSGPLRASRRSSCKNSISARPRSVFKAFKGNIGLKMAFEMPNRSKDLTVRCQPKLEPRSCEGTISVNSADHPRIFFTGIVATKVRPGWITLSVPPFEKWEESLRWLTRSHRERIESPEFFELLQREIPKRFKRQFP